MTPQKKTVAGTATAVALAAVLAVVSTSKRRAIEPPAAVVAPTWITIGADPGSVPASRSFPISENGKTYNVSCDGVKSQCVVADGKCVALMSLVHGAEHSCSWGFDSSNKGGVIFVSHNIVITE